MADGRRPESALDRVLAALDNGLQHSTEPAESVGDLTQCARCQSGPHATGSAFCTGCRELLLREELDVPIVSGPPTLEVVWLAPGATPATGAPEALSAESVAQATLLAQAQNWTPGFVTVRRTLTDRVVVQFVRLVPPELLTLAAQLEQVVLEGAAHGLPQERCVAVVDQEIEHYEQALTAARDLPERVRARLYHEARACACAGERRQPCPHA